MASPIDFTALIRPGDTVMWGQAGAEPAPLTAELMAQRHAIGSFGVFLGVSCGGTVRPEHADCVHLRAYCGTGTNRALAKAGKLDILPCHYSQFPTLMRTGQLRIDALLLQLAPTDRPGEYSLGIAHEYLVPALATARVVIAEINDQAPWTHGERTLRDGELAASIRTSRPPLEMDFAAPGVTELAIARNAAALIGDGATLQLGLGTLPEAIVSLLGDRRNLGVHSGTIGNAVARLMQEGAVTNARKGIDRGRTVAGVLMGSRALYAFAHRNSSLAMRSTEYTHDPGVLARIDSFVAINSALEVDLTGQVNSEIAEGVYVGAVGGAQDFLRAAQRSRGGLPIVTLPATAGDKSRIVDRLHGPVSMPRSDGSIIVTEYGVADLRGLSLTQRVPRMIEIAHPRFRAALEEATPALVRRP